MNKEELQKLKESMPPILGCLEDEYDPRDKKYVYGNVIGADKPPWNPGFDNEVEYSPLREDHQGKSLACVSFGTTNDMEMSVKKNLKQDISFSQRFIYSQIHLSGGGASPRTAYKLLNKQGVCEDKYMPTLVGHNLEETQIIDKIGLDEAQKHALQWRIGTYRSIAPTNVEALAQAIYENGGCGGGYKSFGVTMGHFVFFPAYGYHKGYMGFKFHDSYAPHDKWIIFNNGKFYLDNIQGHQVQLFSMWTAEPGDNWKNIIKETSNMNLTRKRGTEEVFLNIGGERVWIKSAEDFNKLKESQPIEGVEWKNIVDVDEFDTPYNGKIHGKADFSDWIKNRLGLGK